MGQEKLFGKPKDVNYGEVAQALFYAANLTEAKEWRSLAEAVALQAARSR